MKQPSKKKGFIHPDDPAADPPGRTLAQVIIAFVRQGAYPHVAAEAAGVPRRVLQRWLDLATKRREIHKPYRTFADQLRQAQAQARVKAEIAVLDADPQIWLRSGPGKEREGDPGWSATVKAALQSSGNAAMLASPEWNALWCLILKSLASFPDARKALVDAMQSLDSDKVVNALPHTTNSSDVND